MFLRAADLGSVPDDGFVARQLAGVPRERALDWCAQMLTSSTGAGGREFEEQQARVWFDAGGPATGALGMVLSGARRLFAPQILLHLAPLSLVHGSPADPGEHEAPEVLAGYETAMRGSMLVLAQHGGSGRRNADDRLRTPDGTLVLAGPVVTGLEAELAANLLANHRPFPASALDRSERRWVEIPQEEQGGKGVVDLAGEFEAATGVPLSDLRMVGVTLWAMVAGGSGPRAGPGYLDGLGLGAERTAKVLGLISGTAAGLADRAVASVGPGLGSVYDTSVLGERPVVRLANGGLLVVSPRLLVERTLGWLPWWDMTNGLAASGPGGPKRARRAEGYLRGTTQTHADETIAALARASSPPGVPYDDTRIQAAFGTTDRNADDAVDWPEAWVVLEVSSRTVTQGTAAAVSGEALVNDILLGVVEKARQLDGTIRALRRDETLLTGAPRTVPPVLARARHDRGVPGASGDHSEGSGDAPGRRRASGTRRRDGCCRRRRGPGSRGEPGVRGGPNLPALLAAHALSDMGAHGFREWLLVTHGPLRPPSRVMQRWERVLDPVLQALARTEPGGPG